MSQCTPTLNTTMWAAGGREGRVLLPVCQVGPVIPSVTAPFHAEKATERKQERSYFFSISGNHESQALTLRLELLQIPPPPVLEVLLVAACSFSPAAALGLPAAEAGQKQAHVTLPLMANIWPMSGDRTYDD